jgi:phosphatidylcholine synthase
MTAFTVAWMAHLYTALGALCALAATWAVVRSDYRAAFFWLGVQILIDATDGALARALRVKERLPHFDGARLDDIIDYLTYVFVPVLIVLHAGLVPASWQMAVGGAVLLASGYGFSQTAAKVRTTDYFFTGFPSYWNLVVFYMYLLELRPVVNALVLIGFAVLVFVPLRYVYPSRTATLRVPTNVLGVLWSLLLVYLLWRLPEKPAPWIMVSLAFPVYYFALSLWLDRRSRTPGAEMGAAGTAGIGEES